VQNKAVLQFIAQGGHEGVELVEEIVAENGRTYKAMMTFVSGGFRSIHMQANS
jgi:hypothetical protein